jgi:CelD/BcsL family acetyltransferase involved in cellulose biosynthesis
LRRHRALVERGDGRIVCYSKPGQEDAAVDAYESVYGRSWQPAEPFPGYMPGLIRRGIGANEVQVWSLFAGDLPVAAQVWVRRHSHATIFKLAYDQNWGKQSVGTILTMAAMQAALSDPTITEIDLGWGDDPYKQEWLPERRQRYGIAAYNPRSIVGLGLAARNMLPRKLKSLLRSR